MLTDRGREGETFANIKLLSEGPPCPLPKYYWFFILFYWRLPLTLNPTKTDILLATTAPTKHSIVEPSGFFGWFGTQTWIYIAGNLILSWVSYDSPIWIILGVNLPKVRWVWCVVCGGSQGWVVVGIVSNLNQLPTISRFNWCKSVSQWYLTLLCQKPLLEAIEFAQVSVCPANLAKGLVSLSSVIGCYQYFLLLWDPGHDCKISVVCPRSWSL